MLMCGAVGVVFWLKVLRTVEVDKDSNAVDRNRNK